MNLTNGLFMKPPNLEFGAIRWRVQYNGNIIPILATWSAWPIILFLRNPGNPSYQIEASNC